MQTGIPCVLMRGGTSKGPFFLASDLPSDPKVRDEVLIAAMGSPHEYQVDGVGGGNPLSSKVAIISRSTHADADVDYLFAQVLINERLVDTKPNCGNMLVAVAPFAIEAGLVAATGSETVVRIHNVNTGALVDSIVQTPGGFVNYAGNVAIDGVPGTAAPVKLNFKSAVGAVTGKLLPTGKPRDVLDIPGIGRIEVSMVDAANPCVFLDAKSLGLTGTEMPEALDRNRALLDRIAAIRCHASVAMGIARDVGEARSKSMPQIGFVSAPQDAVTLAGEAIAAPAADLTVRIISNGQPHRALPLTGSLCTAVAAGIEGSIPNQYARRRETATLRLAMPSGVLTVGGEVIREAGGWRAVRGSFFRTTRRLFDGYVYT